MLFWLVWLRGLMGGQTPCKMALMAFLGLRGKAGPGGGGWPPIHADTVRDIR